MKKNLSRTEIVQMVWRLIDAGWKEQQIINTCWPELCHFISPRGKVLKKEVAEEVKRLKKSGEVEHDGKPKWERMLVMRFHGTVGNYIMAAYHMPRIVRAQFLLTIAETDRLLVEGETVELKITRYVLNLLTAAMNKDRGNNVWDPIQGGPEFMQKYQQCVAEQYRA